MYHNLKPLLKHRLNPVWLLVGCLSVVMLLTVLGGMWNYQHELNNTSPAPSQTKKTQVSKIASGTIEPEKTASSSGSAKQKATDAKSTKAVNTNLSNPAAIDQAQKPVSTPAQPVNKTVQVSLNVNGAYQGQVTMQSTDNQCSVLSQAFSVGVISSLDMRYSSQYKTSAVYSINGIGDANSIWWTYTVNGRSPPYGCSGTIVHEGDVVNWQYVKQ